MLQSPVERNPATVFCEHFTGGDTNEFEGHGCVFPGCTVKHSRIFATGYFTLDTDGKMSTPFGIAADLWSQRRCGLGHDPTAMVLTKIGGEVKWTCPQPNCNFTLPL